MHKPILPEAANSIQKGVPLKFLLDKSTVRQLGLNLKFAFPDFDADMFEEETYAALDPLTLKERGAHIAQMMKKYLPNNYSRAIEIILASLTPPLSETEDLGRSGMFYMPHVSIVEQNGLDVTYNQHVDPFDMSMKAKYELTRRFTSEFSIRHLLLLCQNGHFRCYINGWMIRILIFAGYARKVLDCDCLGRKKFLHW